MGTLTAPPGPTPATLEGIAAGIDSILAALAEQQTGQTGSISAIPNPMTISAAIAFAQSKGWEVQTNLNANPPTVSFLQNVGGMGVGLVATVNLTV